MSQALHSRRGINQGLLSLLIYRSLASMIVLATTVYFFYQAIPATQQQFLLGLCFALPLLIAIQWSSIRLRIALSTQLLFQFSLDLILVSALIFITGGFQSPFVFLFGLIIIAAGTQAHVLVVMITAITACICYLATIHGFAWWLGTPLPPSFTLNILLQTSAFLLVGGVMAAIARRHVDLEEKQQTVVRQHRRLQELHGQVMASMQEGMLILNHELYIQDSNAAGRRLLATGDEPAGLQLHEIGAVPKALMLFLKLPNHTIFRCEWKSLAQTCLATVTLLPGNDTDAKWLLTLVDISDLRKLESQLIEQDKLAAMGRMLAMLAHEIRNPMQTLAQAVDLMRSVTQDRKQDIQRIVSEEISRLNRLVSDMLDFVQPLQPKPTDTMMNDLLQASVEQMDIACKGVVVWQTEIDRLHIDADHLRLVLDNLLRNAMAVSFEPKSIQVKLIESKSTESSSNWILTVQDQGGGIPQDMKSRLFEPFASNKEDGIGLGLATVWQVCQANGWDIAVENINDGCCFQIDGKISSLITQEDVSHG